MYTEDYDDDEEEKTSENFLVNFYYNNKILVWIFLGIIIFIILITLFTKGGNSNGNNRYDITIYPEGDAYVNIGRSIDLIGFVKDNPNVELNWSSQDESVVKVNNGNVTGIGYGRTLVTAKFIDSNNQEYSATKNVIVSDGDPSITLTNVSFKDGDLFMPSNSTYQIALILTPTRGYVESESFISSNPNVVTVNNTGLVTGVREGEAVITVNVNNGQFKKELLVHVNDEYKLPDIISLPTKISFDGEERKIEVGNKEKLTYTISPLNADVHNLVWKSSDESVLTVEDGTVTAIKEGKVVVTVYSSNGVGASIDIEVVKSIIEVTDISLSETTINLEIGKTKTIIPTVSPADASNKMLSFSSMDEHVVFVEPDETGTKAVLTGVGAGSTTIVITSTNNIEKRITVKVADPYANKDEDWGSYDNDWNGGSSSGSSGSSDKFSKPGFTISSKDANGTGTGFLTTDRSGMKNNNGATAPVIVTVKKTNPNVDKLVISVCYENSSCGEGGQYETRDTKSFTISSTGEFIIKVSEYDSNGNLVREPSVWHIWVKDGGYSQTPVPYNTPTPYIVKNPTVTLSCTKTTIKPGETTTCTASNMIAGDSVKNWIKDGVTQNSIKGNRINLSGQNPGSYKWTVVTNEGASASVIITIKNTNTITPAPNIVKNPTVTLSCTKTTIKPGETTTCTASNMIAGDSVKNWIKDGVVQNSIKGNRINLSGQNPGSYKWTVVTNEGASASVTIRISGSTGNTSNTTNTTNTTSSCATITSATECKLRSNCTWDYTNHCVSKTSSKQMSSLSYTCSRGELIIKDGTKTLNWRDYCTREDKSSANYDRYYYTCTGRGSYTGTKVQSCNAA